MYTYYWICNQVIAKLGIKYVYNEIMSSLHFTFRSFQSHIFPLTLALVTIFVMLAGPDAQRELRYERSSVFTGEVWRLFTAHFVHLGWTHLLMNLIALGLIWGLVWRTLRISAWLAIHFVSMLSVSVGLMIFTPTLEWYVGLSGMLHGLFVAGIIANLAAAAHSGGTHGTEGGRIPETPVRSIETSRPPHAGHRLEIMLLLALCGKVAWEQLYGGLPGSTGLTGTTVIVDAHLYGLVGGLISVLPYVLLQHQTKQ